MKRILLTFLALCAFNLSQGQPSSEDGVYAACQDYIDAFYLGDTLALKRSFSEQLNKFGYWKNDETGLFEFEGYMTYDQALSYSKSINASKKYPDPDAPKKIEVLDVMMHIACAKITAWWGVDYLQLSRVDGQWVIQQVIWEGPLEK